MKKKTGLVILAVVLVIVMALLVTSCESKEMVQLKEENAALQAQIDQLNAQLEREAVEQGFKLHSRFSPGYGDVQLEVQRHFFSLLPCTQRIGLTLTDSLVMAPEKSVTAFIGMEPL